MKLKQELKYEQNKLFGHVQTKCILTRFRMTLVNNLVKIYSDDHDWVCSLHKISRMNNLEKKTQAYIVATLMNQPKKCTATNVSILSQTLCHGSLTLDESYILQLPP